MSKASSFRHDIDGLSNLKQTAYFESLSLKTSAVFPLYSIQSLPTCDAVKVVAKIEHHDLDTFLRTR